MSRVYNFSAGPSTLPESVLEKAGAEILDYHGCGQSVMEMSHRSKVFDDIIKNAEKLMRELYNIPDNYKVLFLQGGASAQFSAIPLNFMTGSGRQITLLPANGLKRLSKKLKNTVMQRLLLLQQIKRLHIFLKQRQRISVKMQIMFIFA